MKIKDGKMKRSKQLSQLTLIEKRELLKKLAQKYNFFTVSLDEYGKYEDDRCLIGILIHRDLYTTVEVLNDEISFMPLHGMWDLPKYTLDVYSADINTAFKKYLPLKDLSNLIKDKDMPKIVEWISISKKTAR